MPGLVDAQVVNALAGVEYHAIKYAQAGDDGRS
jgi:hypothetical protein